MRDQPMPIRRASFSVPQAASTPEPSTNFVPFVMIAHGMAVVLSKCVPPKAVAPVPGVSRSCSAWGA